MPEKIALNMDQFAGGRPYHGLQELKCALPKARFSWSIVTIKGRTLSPIVERSMEVSRDGLKIAAKTMQLPQ